ncbi:MAG: endonuclease/exonuclease/phosphatase family protein, partial [Anaerolineales bacterium]|nr:endonuclease/exonuclease/phosphatase family protein [Anaerolineales bacterium]
GWVRPLRRQLALLAVPCGLWWVTFGALFTPAGWAPAPPPGPSLSVLTFNVRFDQHSPERVLEVIRQSKADVVALQELTTGLDAFLWQNLQATYPYSVTAAADWPWGSGIYSRLPIALVENRATYQGLLDTQEVRLTWLGRSVRLLNFHPAPPTLYMNWTEIAGVPIPEPYDYRADVRHDQVRGLVARLTASAEPTILACDCNLDPASYDYGEITGVLADSFREAGWGFGHTLYFNDRPNFAQSLPLVRIDYVFHSAEWRAMEATALPEASSNHRPVLVRFALP